MKKKMKRILAVVVTFVMLLVSLPVYAAGGDAERTGNDESASFWLQEYDLTSGLETDTESDLTAMAAILTDWLV